MLLHLAEVNAVNYNSLAVTALVFVLAFWGGISFVKGSTKTRMTQASFSIPAAPPAVASTVSRYLQGRGYVADNNADPRPGVVTFTGEVKASTSVSVILVAVGSSGLWAASLILNVLLPVQYQSENWGWIALLSLLVVPWYRNQAQRTEELKVMVEQADGSNAPYPAVAEESVLYIKGHRDEIISLEEGLGWVRNDPDAPDNPANIAAAVAAAAAETAEEAPAVSSEQ
jgi:Cofactor assembly of complex C subunit B